MPVESSEAEEAVGKASWRDWSPPPKPKFSMGKWRWAIVAVVVIGGLLQLMTFLMWHPKAGTGPYAAGRITGIVAFNALSYFLYWGVGWFFYRVSGRERAIGRAMATVLAVFLLYSSISNSYRNWRQRSAAMAAMSEIDQSVNELRESVAKQIEEQGYADPDPDQLSALQDQINESLKYAKGDDRRVAEVIVRFNHEMIDRLKQYEVVTTAFEEAGGDDEWTIVDEADLDLRIKLLDAVVAEAVSMVEFFRAAPSRLEGEWENAGVSEKNIERSRALFQQGSNAELTLESRRLDVELFKCRRGMLGILKTAWGEWEYDDEDEAVAIYNDEAFDQYIDLYTKLMELTEQADAVMLKIVEAQGGPGG